MGPQFTVIPYDIIGNRIFGLDKALITRGGDPFTLQTPEEPFHRAIIPTVALAVCALCYPIAPQRLAVLTTAIVTSLITWNMTPSGRPRHSHAISNALADSFSIRRTALMAGIPLFTTMSGAHAAMAAISALQNRSLAVNSLQSYLKAS